MKPIRTFLVALAVFLAASTAWAYDAQLAASYAQLFASVHGAKAGKELTGENIKASMEGLKDFSTGNVTAPITFTGSDHRGNKTLKVYQVKGGKWEPVTDFLTAQ